MWSDSMTTWLSRWWQLLLILPAAFSYLEMDTHRRGTHLPSSQPQDEPSPGEQLEIGGHFFSQGWIAVRLTHHERPHTKLRKLTGKIAQGGHALVCGDFS